MRKKRVRRRPIAEINVVPDIDVMLVLLIIFMVTAPLIAQGVNVELPQAEAEVSSVESPDPVGITGGHFGGLYLDRCQERNLPVDAVTLQGRLRTVLRHNPKLPILVKGDAAVDYGKVVQAMVLAQGAGAPSVGLITVPPERPEP